MLKFGTEKSEYIDGLEQSLDKSIGRLERKLYETILEEFILSLESDTHSFSNTGKNIQAISQLDNLFRKFVNSEVIPVLSKQVTGLLAISSMNRRYYTDMVGSFAKVDAIHKQVLTDMKVMLGIDNKGTILRDGFLDTYIQDKSLLREIKRETFKAVTSTTISLSQYVKTVSKYIKGTKADNSKFRQHFTTFSNDIFVTFDRQVNSRYGEGLKLKHALYAGGLIKTSRPFCIERNGNVFTVEEIKKFGTAADKYGGYTNKSKGLFSGKNENYDALRDGGGHGCRHLYNFITDSMAVRLRPELKPK